MARHTLPRGWDKALVDVSRYIHGANDIRPSKRPLTELLTPAQIGKLLSLHTELKTESWHDFLMIQWVNGYEQRLGDSQQNLSTTVVLKAQNFAGDIRTFLTFRVENQTDYGPPWMDLKVITVPDWFNTQPPVTDWRQAQVLLTRYVDTGRGTDGLPFSQTDIEHRPLRDVIRDTEYARELLNRAKPYGKCQILMTIRSSKTQGSYSLLNDMGVRITLPYQFEIPSTIRDKSILSPGAWNFGQDGYWHE